MSESAIYRPAERNTRDRAHTLFGQTMGYVAMTAGLFALGACLAATCTAVLASSRSSPRRSPR